MGGRGRERERERKREKKVSCKTRTHALHYFCTLTYSTYSRSSDYQRISEQLKKQGAAKRPPPWPSHENRSMKTPPRRIHTTDSIGSGPPTPQHQSQAFLNSSLNASPGGGSIPMHPRDRLNTIDIRPQPRMPDGGYDTYDVSIVQLYIM